ncbi:cathepsin O-like [Glandiceps talaboti]
MAAYSKKSRVLFPAVCAILVFYDYCVPTKADKELRCEENRFQRFIVSHNKTYAQGTAEYEQHFRVFKETLLRIDKLNALSSKNNDTAVYGITKFADLTPEEFKQQYLMLEPQRKPAVALSDISNDPEKHPIKLPDSIPDKYDLRDLKAVTPIRDQESCGGCWAFSTVESMETKRVLDGGPLVELSVQQVIDCDTTSSGCKGGDTCEAMQWLEKSNTGITEAKKYHFTGKTGICKSTTNITAGVHLKSHTCNQYKDESEMVKALYLNGSLAVAVDASSWQDYLGGIIQHHCSHGYNNHAVQIIGYDMTGKIPYYIVRNSWGHSWGLNGCLHVKIGGNLCGIASRVSTVEIERNQP